ncbi:hypothetical protein BC939DRAFT_464248 [Gamsiella multidivaricata]|uniref:uncharacterized protein n=1 Tax=Gamsiella multidivaricata TaxID=101098 RepID=UPI00221F6B6D|nr:uncharacterized protein BC939DRAFT_464248 [Gamsiella multidivaricata]KAI7817961.1 hypothetical protein BC939DRAFT_464248 [Gamsiella multidivaricata]
MCRHIGKKRSQRSDQIRSLGDQHWLRSYFCLFLLVPAPIPVPVLLLVSGSFGSILLDLFFDSGSSLKVILSAMVPPLVLCRAYHRLVRPERSRKAKKK